MRIAAAASVAACLVLLLSWLSLRAVNPEAELFDRSLTEIDHFTMLENALYRDVFAARTGTLAGGAGFSGFLAQTPNTSNPPWSRPRTPTTQAAARSSLRGRPRPRPARCPSRRS